MVLSAWAAQTVSAQTQSRKLSLGKIAGYAPASKVTDHNAIDLDQKYMEVHLGLATADEFINAKQIYEEGGNSKSYAEITLDNNLVSAIPKKSKVTGKTSGGAEVTGTVYKDADSGQKILKVQYDTSETQATHVTCRVGGLQNEDNGAMYDGCLKDIGSVSVTVGETTTPLSYAYDPLTANKNGRTLQGFSTAVQEKMIDCSPGCPFPDAAMYREYYGVPDYGDQWITAAFNGQATQFTRGNADFAKYSFIGKGEAIKKGSAYMNVFMYVIREFEDAVVDCKTECDTGVNCNDDPVHAWDEGVAFYAGSLEGEDGETDGKLLHALADKRCQNYGTCGPDSDSAESETSFVNHELIKLFGTGRDQLLGGKCGAAKPTLRAIVELMYIPLIQGVLRYAYKVDKLSGGEKEKAEGAVFTAAVLPRIHNASPTVAATIYDNMMVDAPSTSFADVKSGFESVYSELKITCAQVGGLISADGSFYEGAEPCNDGRGISFESSAGCKGIIVAAMATVGVIASLI